MNEAPTQLFLSTADGAFAHIAAGMSTLYCCRHTGTIHCMGRELVRQWCIQTTVM